jgi:hypothetical protein
MPSIKRLLQRMQCKLALLLRPGETPPCKRDLNLPHSPRIEKLDSCRANCRRTICIRTKNV